MPVQNSILPPTATLVSSLWLLALSCTVAHSVIMPPRFHSSQLAPPLTTATLRQYMHNDTLEFHHLTDEAADNAHAITLDEDGSIDVLLNTKSHITINLNRAVGEDLVVDVIVNAGSNLILFDQHLDKLTTTTDQPTPKTTTSVIFKANTFGDRIVSFHSTGTAGHAQIVCKIAKQPQNLTIDDSSAFISVNIGKNSNIGTLIYVVGWLYFVAWSLSFYFQIVLNYQRQSVVGLNFDFLALNLFGFTCYSIYNFTLMFSHEVKQSYYERHSYTRIPVEYNDLFFSAHAFLITLITVLQCLIYERGQQKVSLPASLFLGITMVAGFGLYVARLLGQVNILDVVIYLSYVKLAITLIKYTPQAYMNYRRKATTGWSIYNILLDFTGGILSISQMLLLAYNYDDWMGIFGNFTKFGLGIFSMLFDVLFVVQHYVLYTQNESLEDSTDSGPEPVINRSIRSLRSASQQQA